MNRRAVLQRLALLPLLGPVIAKIATSPPAPPVWRFMSIVFWQPEWAHYQLMARATIVHRLTGEQQQFLAWTSLSLRHARPVRAAEQQLSTWLLANMEDHVGPIAGWPLRLKIWPGR